VLLLFLGFDPPNLPQARMSCRCHRQGHRNRRPRGHRNRHRRLPPLNGHPDALARLTRM